jgi:HK97 family phage major capsid protein
MTTQLDAPVLEHVRRSRDAARENRSRLARDMQAILDATEQRGDTRLLASDQRRYDAIARDHAAATAEFEELTDRVEELLTLENRSREANEARRVAGGTHISVNEPNPVYRKGDRSTSFFRDLAIASDPSRSHAPEVDEARRRLAASQETRSGDISTTAGHGGEFAPPWWAVEDWISLARPGRATADLCHHEVLPSGISSVNLPAVATGSAVGVQATQNSAVTDVAMTTTSISSGITTLAGAQIVSLQQLEQTPVPFDQVILQDLAADYAKQLDLQVLYGTNASGQLNGLVNGAAVTTFTSGSPAPASVTNANSFYYSVSKAAVALQTARYKAASAIIMHPRRWGWILGAVDTSSRPLVVPAGGSFNPLGTTGPEPVAENFAGTFGGYPVYTDPNISITANSTTNQDEAYIVRSDDIWLYETPIQPASFTATFANNLSVLFRCHGFAALVTRYAASVQVIRGTGMLAP